MSNKCPGCGREISPDALCSCSYNGMHENGTSSILPEGSVLNGRFIIKELLKTGAMVTVYKAEDKDSKEICLVKELKPFWAELQEEKDHLTSRFKSQSKIFSGFKCAAIPRLIDYFVLEDCYYLVKEFVEGDSLEDIMKISASPGLPYKQVVKWGIQICEVLEYLHEQKPAVVYKDIKPTNFISALPDNSIVLIDYGIACTLQEGLPVNILTTIGNMDFMSPEQLLGKVGPASDIFSLGATLYYLLTGAMQTLFDYKPVSTIIPGISEKLDDVIRRSLEFKPEDRFKTATEMRLDLERILDPHRLTTRKLSEVDLWISYLFGAKLDEKTKLEAISKLETFDVQKATIALMKILEKDGSTAIRQAAALALGNRKDPSCIQVLIDKTKDKKSKVAAACIKSLVEFDDVRVLSCLTGALKSKSRKVRKEAALSLEKIGDQKAIDPLKEAIKNEKDENKSLKKTFKKVLKKLKNLDEEETEDDYVKEAPPPAQEKDTYKPDYKPKDRIYLKLLNELLEKDPNSSVPFILINKAKMDQRFFEVMDREYNIAAKNEEKKRTNDISYLMRVMDNLRIRENMAPPYEPTPEELDELMDIMEGKIEPEEAAAEEVFDDILIDDSGAEPLEEREPLIEEKDDIPEDIKRKIQAYKNILMDEPEVIDEMISYYRELKEDYPDSKFLSESIVWAVIKKGDVVEGLRSLGTIMEPGLGEKVFSKIYPQDKYVTIQLTEEEQKKAMEQIEEFRAAPDDIFDLPPEETEYTSDEITIAFEPPPEESEDGPDEMVIAFEPPEEHDSDEMVIAFEPPPEESEDGPDEMVIAFEPPEEHDSDEMVIAFEPPPEESEDGPDEMVIAFEPPEEHDSEEIVIAFEPPKEEEEKEEYLLPPPPPLIGSGKSDDSESQKRPLIFKRSESSRSFYPGSFYPQGEPEEQEETLHRGRLLIFEEPDEEEDDDLIDEVSFPPPPLPPPPEKVENNRNFIDTVKESSRNFIIDETTIEVIEGDISPDKINTIIPLMNIEFSEPDLRKILNNLKFGEDEINLTLSHTAETKKDLVKREFITRELSNEELTPEDTPKKKIKKKRFTIKKKKKKAAPKKSDQAKMPERRFKKL